MMNMPNLPPLTLGRALWAAPADWLVTALCLMASVAYLAGVYRLHRRGHRWPVRRTVLWLSGWVIIYLVSGGGFAGYGMVMFSAHMVQHMALTMYAPVLLVLGAPVTLLLRVLPARPSPTSPRKLLVLALHSRVLAFLSCMPMAVALFVFSLFGLYFTPLLSLLMSTMPGHELMQAHFLVTGYLFAWTFIGSDPGPRRPAELPLAITIFPLAAIHAFFAVMLTLSPRLLGEPFFGMVKPGWLSLWADQYAAGGLAGGMSEIPLLAIAAVLLLGWFRRLERRTPARARPLLIDGEYLS